MISLESWVNIMYYVQDAHSFWDWIYFVALIVVRTMDRVPACVCVSVSQFLICDHFKVLLIFQVQKHEQIIFQESLIVSEVSVRNKHIIFCHHPRQQRHEHFNCRRITQKVQEQKSINIKANLMKSSY